MSSVQVPEGYKQTEVGVIPEDWKIESLNNLTQAQRPISYGIVQTGKQVQNGVKCIRVLDITQGRIDDENLITTSDKISDSYKRTILIPGDLIIALRGKIGELAVVPNELGKANLTRGVALIALNDSYLSSFYHQYLSSSDSKIRLKNSLNGSALQELTIGALRSFSVVTLPLPEQSAIAQTLSDVDALIVSLDKLIAKQRQLKTAAMQQLLTGKMRLPGFGEGKGYKQTEVGIIPEDWNVRYLSNIADVRDGTHASPKYKSEGIPLVTSKNIIGGNLDLTDISYISKKDAEEINKRSKVDIGDIIMSMIGTIGNAVILSCAPNFCIKNVALFKSIKIDKNYLIQLISSSGFQNYLQDQLDGGIQKFISLGSLRELLIISPALSEQRAIATVLSDMDTAIAALETRRAKTQAIKQGMMQELLTGRTRLV